MEWVETTARTVEEAKDLLLDQLGVDESDTEFEILEEPKPGLFGRTKGQARVRARVRPKTPPSRDDRRRRPARGKDRAEGSGGTDKAEKAEKASEPKAPRPERKPRSDAPVDASSNGGRDGGRDGERSGSRDNDRSARDENAPRLASDIAERESEAFLQGVLDSFGVTATIAITVDEEGDLSAEVTGEQLGRLIGPRGGVISAIEELTRTRLQHVASGGSTPRFRLDIGGYRGSRRPNLEILVDEVVEKVRTSGQAHVLDVVLAGERKLVHDRVAETAPDLRTHSEGEDPVRRVVLSPS